MPVCVCVEKVMIIFEVVVYIYMLLIEFQADRNSNKETKTYFNNRYKCVVQ